jgi:hypothetical protein
MVKKTLKDIPNNRREIYMVTVILDCVPGKKWPP